MEEMFNGFGQYQTYVKYVFGKASAIIKKVDDKYTIKFDSNGYDLNNTYSECDSEFKKLVPRVEVSHDSNTKWFVTSGIYHFNDETKFTKENINLILLSIKNSVAFADSHDNGVKNTVPKVKLMTREEMIELYNKKELTPAEISLKSWELKRAYTVQNKCTSIHQITNDMSCALCYDRDKTTGVCNDCSLYKVDKRCLANGSAYDNIDNYDEEDNEEFVKLIDTLIEKLKLAVQLEKKEKSVEKIKDIKKKLTIIVTPVKDNKVTLEIENCISVGPKVFAPKIYYLNTSKEIAIRDKCSNYIRPVGCKYVHPGDDDYISIGPDNPIPIEAADEIIEGIKDAANHLHKTNHGECTGEHSCTDTIHRVHGVKIVVKDVGCGRASISIDANGYDFDPDRMRITDGGSGFWRSYTYPEYNWYVDGHDVTCGERNKFNNGYVDKKEVIGTMIKHIKNAIEYNHSRGILKKQITEKQVIVV